MNKKGQQMLANVIGFIIIAIIAAVLSPVLSTFMSSAINSSNATGTTLLLMQSVVPMFWVGIIVLFFVMILYRGAPPQMQ